MSNTSNRELTITRLLNAPIELVWQVFTEPEHIKNFWGPSGYTNTITKMDVKVGGEWAFIMHGPDGTDYENKHIYLEIKKPVRLVMQHATTPKFITAITLKAEGKKTLLHWSGVFESAEQLEQILNTVKEAKNGLKENVDKLETYLYKL